VVDKERLVRAVRKDWLAGMRQADVARKHDVTPGFVRYHTVDKEYERNRWNRRKEAVRVDVVCCDCGDPAILTKGAIQKRERLNMGPYRCRPCGQYGWTPERLSTTDNSWMLPEERVQGEHGIRHWAWREVKKLTRKERYCVSLMDIEAIRDVDDSRPARHARPRRDREEFRPGPYARLEQPFGAAARGERDAA